VDKAAEALRAMLGEQSVQRPDRTDGQPAFDVARIEPTGEAVIAGRAGPGATVELLRGGQLHDKTVANENGEFVLVPRPLPPGNYDLTLRSRQRDGQNLTSLDSVAVVLRPERDERPLVALVVPDKPTLALAKPAMSKVEHGSIAIDTVDTESGGKLYVSGRSEAGSVVRLYLNDAYIASATASTEGRVAFAIESGVRAGDYRVRLDRVDPASGSVRSRAEASFNAPATAAASASAVRPAPTLNPANEVRGPVDEPTAGPPQLTHPAAAERPELARPSVLAETPAATAIPRDTRDVVVVPKIETTVVSRGDNLWRISRLTYGKGIRYSIIFDANRDQIRDPDLIYPGQIFVLPQAFDSEK
jgi:nucleoid-associated protein YgaU